MAQQKGRLLLIKRESTDPQAAGTFETVGGFRDRSLETSLNVVDTTVPDRDNPNAVPQRTNVAGIVDHSFSGSGLFDDHEIGKAVADDNRLGNAANYQIIVPGYGTYEGPFIVSKFAWNGGMEGNLEFSADFVPAGALSFTAE